MDRDKQVSWFATEKASRPFSPAFTSAGEEIAQVGNEAIVATAASSCIKSTHNVLNAERMHSCHSPASGESQLRTHMVVTPSFM